MKLMKILYKPFAIITGLIGAALGRKVFKAVWSRIDEEEPPKATTPEVPLGKVVGARALEAATMAGVGAAVDRASLNSFRYLTGVWAGKQKEDESEKS
jgi:Protein of unknown function (DUF4235)